MYVICKSGSGKKWVCLSHSWFQLGAFLWAISELSYMFYLYRHSSGPRQVWHPARHYNMDKLFHTVMTTGINVRKWEKMWVDQDLCVLSAMIYSMVCSRVFLPPWYNVWSYMYNRTIGMYCDSSVLCKFLRDKWPFTQNKFPGKNYLNFLRLNLFILGYDITFSNGALNGAKEGLSSLDDMCYWCIKTSLGGFR